MYFASYKLPETRVRGLDFEVIVVPEYSRNDLPIVLGGAHWVTTVFEAFESSNGHHHLKINKLTIPCIGTL